MDFNKIPFVQAKWYTPTDGRDRRKIVIHSMEAPEKGGTALATAKYFQQLPSTRKASAHYCIDGGGTSNAVVQCVQTKDVAYGAGGANHDGIHLELAGYARQSEAQWLDSYSLAMLEIAAQLCGKILVPKTGIPVVYLDEADLKNSPKSSGFTTHGDISRAFKRSTHWDPGPGFPMIRFLEMVKQNLP